MSLSSRVFCFGDYATHCFGLMTLDEGGEVRGYCNEREDRWSLVDGELRFLLRGSEIVTSRLRLVCEEPLLFHGASTADNNRLYLRELLSLQSLAALPSDPARPPLLINTVPKSGTYWLRQAFLHLGSQPTCLHLGNSLVHDQRGLPDDERIHREPWLRRTSLPLSLLGPALPAGSVSVGHVHDRREIEELARQGVAMIQVVRNLRDVIASLYHFKRHVVDPAHDRDPSWRHASDPTSRFLGFISCYRNNEIQVLADCVRCFTNHADPVTLRFEDLVNGHVNPCLEPELTRILGKPDALAYFREALRVTYRQPTSTLRRVRDKDRDEVSTIRNLAAAFVAGTEFAELNMRNGYAAESPPCTGKS